MNACAVRFSDIDGDGVCITVTTFKAQEPMGQHDDHNIVLSPAQARDLAGKLDTLADLVSV